MRVWGLGGWLPPLQGGRGAPHSPCPPLLVRQPCVFVTLSYLVHGDVVLAQCVRSEKSLVCVSGSLVMYRFSKGDGAGVGFILIAM